MMAGADLLIEVAQNNPDTPTLDLHGERTENALKAVDFFLHQSSYAGVSVIKIVYGVGTGALARSVPTYCKQHSLVARAREALVPGESGTAIYVVLKKYYAAN